MIADNSDLFERHDAEQEAELRKLPVCCKCKEHIQQEEAVCYNGKWYCEDDEEHQEDIL